MEKNRDVLRELSEPFNFYAVITKSGHLHFGFWPEESPDLSLEEAQERMFAELLPFFPRPPAAVLDVGCGFGVSAHALSRLGYEVTGIAPDAALIRHAAERFGGERLDFQVADFLSPSRPPFLEKSYEVVFFQESLQYFPDPVAVFRRCRDLLTPGGIVIIGDEIRVDDRLEGQTAVHSRRELLLALDENGFRLTRDRAIGERVEKTCDRVIEAFTGNFDAIVAAVDQPNAADRLRFFLNGWESQQKWYAAGRMDYGLFVARKDPVFIRAYREGDEEHILPMFNRIFSQNRTFEHWRWKYRDNPFGFHKIVVAVGEDGTLAGHFAAYPVLFYSMTAQPTDFMVFHGGDTMTNPEYRHLGRGKTSVLSRMFSYFYPRFCIGNIPFIYGYNTATIRKLGERYLGYEYTSPISQYVLDLNQQSLPVGSPLRMFFSGFAVKRITGVDEDFDRFFERVAGEYHSLVKRSFRYLQWRYFECPDTDYHVFAIRKWGRLVGWSVFKCRGEVLVWGDALFDRSFAAVAVPALLAQARRNFSERVNRIEAWFSPNPSWWIKILQHIGFTAGPEPNNLAPAYTIFDRHFSVDCFEKNNYYTMGDSDLF